MIKRRVLLFLKAPRPGTVKTRLAATLGNEAAASAYRRLVERQLQALPERHQIEIHYAPADAETEMRDWLGGDLTYFTQVDGDLGDRLSAGVASAFQRGADEVVCLGGDCPTLDREHLAKASEQFDHGADAVLGPTEDGGYYLLALRQHHACLFKDIPWSQDHTLQVTLQRARSNGLQTRLLPVEYDVDTQADWDRARKILPPAG